MNHHIDQPQPNDTLKATVMDCIANRTVTPRSRLYFQAFEVGMWAMWMLSIAVGATAVAIILYVGEHGAYALIEATHESAVAFWVDALPYAWVGIFLLMGGVAYLNFRHTCRGYRYSNVMVIGSSVGLSVLFGTVLHVGGASGAIEQQFARMPHYPSMEKKELAMWQNPSQGRLVGMATDTYSGGTIRFTDTDETVWTVVTAELDTRDVTALFSGERIRLIGLASTTKPNLFHGCAVFVWPYQAPESTTELRQMRNEFLDRMRRYKEMPPVATSEAAGYAPCRHLELLERIR